MLSLFLVLSFTVSAGAKTLKVGLDADPVSLDIQVQLSGGMLQLAHWVADPLVRWTTELTFEPRLATKWERMDDLTMRFYLRKGVKFHSGNTFSAKDVKKACGFKVTWGPVRVEDIKDFISSIELLAIMKSE